MKRVFTRKGEGGIRGLEQESFICTEIGDVAGNGDGMSVPLIATLFLVFTLFFISRVARGSQAVWIGLMLFTFGCCLMGLLGLISRFLNYRLEGLMILPIGQPGSFTGFLSHMSLDNFMRFRLWAMVAFVVSFIGFAMSYTREPGHSHTEHIWLVGGMILAAASILWFYDPGQLFNLYKKGARILENQGDQSGFLQIIRLADVGFLGLIIACLSWATYKIFQLWRRCSIVQKRAQALCVIIGCGVLEILFIMLFCIGPAQVLNAYAVTTTLLPVTRYPEFNTIYLRFMPFAVAIALGAVMLSIFRYGFLGKGRISGRELERQIKVANRAVRLALHSFKNRFLAVQMSMDMAALKMADMQGEEADEVRQQIQWAHDVSTEALSQLETLRMQAGRLEIQWTTLGLNALCDEAIALNQGCLEKINLHVNYSQPEVMIWGDHVHLVSVLDNLIQNSVDALSEKAGRGWVEVEIGREYELGYVRITDNGVGITHENLRKVFRPFFTTKPSRNNWGLGLVYCHRVIVKSHGGYINLRTYPGSGTTVEIALRCRENLDIRKFNPSSTPTGVQKKSVWASLLPHRII